MSFDAVQDYLLTRVESAPWQPVQLREPVAADRIPTPALLLERAAFERNLQRMRVHLAAFGKQMRPHAKTHKCPHIAHQQLAAGAAGICVAKLGEAAALSAAGVQDLLVTSPVVTPDKARLIDRLAQRAQAFKVVVDSLQGLAVLQAALSTDTRLGVVLDIDVEMGRTGIRDDGVLARLAEQVGKDPRLYLAGVQHYAGHLMHLEAHAERRQRSLASWEKVMARVAAIGLQPEIVTGGGTGTFDIDVEVAALTDIQVGSFIFMDQEYRVIGAADGGSFEFFEPSLFVQCTAISQPRTGTITVDGGFKVFASDTVPPEPADLPGVRYRFGGDEHGILLLGEGQQAVQLGGSYRFIVPHCDPTVNLHDAYWVLDPDGYVRELWPITARGCAW